MKFSSYIFAITALMTLTGFLALGLVEEVGKAFKVFAGAGLAAALVLHRSSRFKLSHALWNLTAALVFAFFIADYFLISQSLIGAGAKFMTILLALKLLDLKTSRDYTLFFLLVFFELLACAASTVSLLFFPLLTIFIVLSIWAMIVFNMRRDSLEWSRKKTEPPNGVFGLNFLFITFAMTIVSLILTLGLFFIIPRMGVGLFQIKSFTGLKSTAFSEEVELGTLGEVKQDPTIIMRVGIDGDRGNVPRAYFKGMTHDHYDGKKWSKTLTSAVKIKKNQAGLFLNNTKERLSGTLIKQTIMLEPLDTKVIFSMQGWTMLAGSFNTLWSDNSGGLTLAYPPYKRLRYTVWAVPNSSASSEALTREDERAYLQLPKHTERIRKLAVEVSEGGRSDYEKAKKIEHHLRGGYDYTLDPKKGSGETPLDDFLFFSKEGYCEQYASAMVIMLRTLNISARLVTGYLEGGWNGFGKYYIVRQQDAHSWVEAYFPDRGWTSFDPTASGGFSTSGEFSALTYYLDTLKWRWNKNIISFDFKEQMRLGRGIESTLFSLKAYLLLALKEREKKATTSDKDQDGNFFDSNKIFFFPALVLIIIFFLLTQRRFSKKDSRKTPDFYLKVLKILEKKGLKRKETETALEFAKRSGIRELGIITKAFEVERYGLLKSPEKTILEITELTKKIKSQKPS